MGESPEAAAYAREPTRLPLEVIDELSPTFRKVVRPRDVDDRPPRRFARRLHISTRNVAVRLNGGGRRPGGASLHQVWPGGLEYAGIDIFRFDDAGKIVEHRDVLQKVPKAAAHENGMF